MAHSLNTIPHTLPSDQAERERFVGELRQNFSVIAPAGVGKTRAIVERVAAITTRVLEQGWLEDLLVVTYTDRAAKEMQRRARQEVLRQGIAPQTMARFNQAFFGTIHGLCVRILQTHGHFLGIPARFKVADEATLEELWHEFLSSDVPWGAMMPDSQRDTLVRFVNLFDLFTLAQKIRLPLPEPLVPLSDCPSVHFGAIYEHFAAIELKKPLSATSENDRSALRRFERCIAAGESFCKIPSRKGAAKAFVEIWDTAFAPLQEWLAQAALHAAADIAQAFRQFRIAQGVLTFDDQISLTVELLEHPEASARLLERSWRIILDEAQDTDPLQFRVLLRLAQGGQGKSAGQQGDFSRAIGSPVSSPPLLFLNRSPQFQPPPLLHLAQHCPPGRFCMVGDFQQSIYRERADIPTYRQHHEDLAMKDANVSATFQVTFRCSRAIVRFVNAIFPHVLSASLGQADFVPLEAAASATEGRVLRLQIPALPSGQTYYSNSSSDTTIPDITKSGRSPARAVEQHEAECLANTIVEAGALGLGAAHWGQVAVLCPRIKWFRSLRNALALRGIETQSVSTHDIAGDHPARAWFTALAWVMAEPTSAYEIVGVLRELFGLSDEALALYSSGDGTRFDIATSSSGRLVTDPCGSPNPQTSDQDKVLCAVDTGQELRETCPSVAATLLSLTQIREEIAGMPLRTAAAHLITATELRDRLYLLPDAHEWSMDEELETMLALASHAEMQGLTFRAFAHQLHATFHAPREAAATNPNAIQLITSYKAKGLEWDVVIIPFLYREIFTRHGSYPRLLSLSPEQNPRILFSKHDAYAERGDVALLQRLEFERLLYVMCTRARHSLIIVDDATCWESSPDMSYPTSASTDVGGGGSQAPPVKSRVSRSKANFTFAESLLLEHNGDVQRNWNELPRQLAAPSESSELKAGQQTLTEANPVDLANLRPLLKTSIPLFTVAQESWERRLSAIRAQVADHFPCRITPHSLAHSAALGAIDSQLEPEDERPLNGDRPGGVLYGTWWHALMESFVWQNGSHAERALLSAQALAHCLLPDRARRELDLLERSPLPDLLSNPNLLLHTELPFLLPNFHSGKITKNCNSLNGVGKDLKDAYRYGNTGCDSEKLDSDTSVDNSEGDEVLEGLIDLAWFDPEAKQWTLLDWKTNYITSAQSSELQEHYRPQLQAYVRALTKLTGYPAFALLYSTPLGEVFAL